MGELHPESAKRGINLQRGWPSRELLPVQLIKEAAQAILSDPSIAHGGLLYGPDEGYQPARQAISEWLTDFYQPRRTIGLDRICITGGASQSLGCMLDVYTEPEYTRNIWIVAPAYMLAFPIFEDAGFAKKLRAVPEDEHGIDIDYLRREMEASEQKAQSQGNLAPRFKSSRPCAKIYKHVIYCVPTFSNPSSRTMTLDRRHELVRLAREYDALVTTDDVYDFLQWPASIPTPESHVVEAAGSLDTALMPRLVDIDRELDGGAERSGADGFGNACSNGSFSKILGPGLRVGWVEGEDKFAYGLSQSGISRSGGNPSQLTSTYVTRLLETGQLQHHTRNVLRPAYASRYRTLMEAIDTKLVPLGFRMPQPDRNVLGGYFIWLSLPKGLDAEELAVACRQDENLVIAPGKIFEVPGDDKVLLSENIRLSFAWEDEPYLSEGVARLCKIAERLLAQELRPRRGAGEYVLADH